jgi:hypothetical protein
LETNGYADALVPPWLWFYRIYFLLLKKEAKNKTLGVDGAFSPFFSCASIKTHYTMLVQSGALA